MANNKAHGDLWDKAITANPTRDNGATVLMGGAIDSSPTVTSAPDTVITGAGKKQPTGVVQSEYTGAVISNAAGTFAVLAPGHYIVKGGNITTQLAGIAYRGLRGAGNQNQIRSIHSLLTRTTLIIVDWLYSTGEVTSSSTSSDNFGNVQASYDDYAVPTRALPGNVVIIDFDGLDPTVVALPAKTG